MKEVIITSSVLILALLILRAIFARKVRRTLIYGTWLLVALRLLLPLQIGNLSISVLNSFRPVTDAITDISQKQVAGVTEQDAYRQVLEDYIEKDQTVFTPQVQEQINTELDKQVPKEEIATMIDKVYSDQEVYVPEVRPQVQQLVADTADPVTLGVIVRTLWLLGAIVVALWLASGNLFFVRSLRKSAVPVDIDSPVPVYASEKAISPCLVGLFRPAVYVAPEVAENKALLHYVMTHELTHYAHRDHIWSAVRCLCLCLHWFNPLVWVAAFCSRRDCELACDEGALRRLGEDQRIPYGKALLEVVRETAVPNKLKFTATTMAENKRQLLQRMRFIATNPRWSTVAAISMALVCVLVVGCVATGAATVPDMDNLPEPEVTEPTAPTTATEQPRVSSGFRYTVNRDATTCTIRDLGICNDTDVVIPESIDGYTVTNVEKLRSPFITSIVMPDSVTGIGSGAFKDCTSLSKITLSQNLIIIPSSTFQNCAQLEEIQLPEHIIRIESNAFDHCSKLKQIVIPDAVEMIRSSAFSDCYSLTDVTIGKEVWHIDTTAFANCGNLSRIAVSPENAVYYSNGTCLIHREEQALVRAARNFVIPSDGSVTLICYKAFSGQLGMEKIILPQGVSRFDESIFLDCFDLREVYLPNTLNRMMINFENCPALEAIYFNGTIDQLYEMYLEISFAGDAIPIYCTDGPSIVS